MKQLTIIFAALTSASLHALPQHWTVDLAAQPPQVYSLQRPRGETYELEAVLKKRGKPFAPAITNACIYWQTNGMENLYWSAPASVSNNVLRAYWLPEMDPGASSVRGYIGDPGHIYAAAFQLRFIASPGALPNELPLPVPVIDFAKVSVLNPPWPTSGGGSTDTNAVRALVDASFDGGTNAVNALPPRVTALEDEVASHVENYNNPHGVTMEQIGITPSWLHPDYGVAYADKAGFATELRTAIGPSYGPEAIAAIELAATNAAAQAATNAAAITSHVADTNNPHGVTAEQLRGRRLYLEGLNPPEIDLCDFPEASGVPETHTVYGTDGIKAHCHSLTYPSKSGTFALDNDIPGNYAAVSNAAMVALKNGGNEINNSCSIYFANSQTEFSNYIGFYVPPFIEGSPYIEVHDHDWSVRGAKYYPNRIEHYHGSMAFPEKSGTLALTSDIPDVSGIATNASAIATNAANIAAEVETRSAADAATALSATNYTDAATNATLAAAMAYTDAHTGGVVSVEYVYSLDGFRRHDVDGNLFEAAIVTGGVFRVVSTKPDRRFDHAYTYAGKHYKSSGAWDGYIWKYNRVGGGYDAVIYYTYEGRFWIDNVGDLLTYKDLNPVNGDDMSPTNTLPNVTVTFTPQGAPVWPSEPTDRFARPSDIAAETARATAAEAAVALSAKAYTDSVLGPISTALDAILGGH